MPRYIGYLHVYFDTRLYVGALAPEVCAKSGWVCANALWCARILSSGFIPMDWLVTVFPDG